MVVSGGSAKHRSRLSGIYDRAQELIYQLSADDKMTIAETPHPRVRKAGPDYMDIDPDRILSERDLCAAYG